MPQMRRVTTLAVAAVLGAPGAGLVSALAATAPPVVGTTSAVTRTVTVSGKGMKPHRLRAGERLRLGAKLTFHAGATATLRLRRPASVPASRDLVLIGSPKGVKLSIKVTRKGAVTVVKIAPVRASAART